MKKELPAWLMLGLVTMVAGLLLGFANDQTKDRIAEQARIAADQARQSVLQEAETFEEQQIAEGDPVDNLYMGKAGENTVGYVSQVTVKGYGGDIEVITGMNMDGVVTGISVGGANFAETAGLGAKSKDLSFTEQFRNKNVPLALGADITAISGATITSNAVITAVNTAAEYIMPLVNPDAVIEQAEPVELLPGNPSLTEGTPDETVAAVWTAENGMVVETTAPGYDSDFHVKVGILTNGTIHAVEIIKDTFHETPGVGSLVREDKTFLEQFVGLKDKAVLGENVNAISGATFSSEAVLIAVNKALAFAAK